MPNVSKLGDITIHPHQFKLRCAYYRPARAGRLTLTSSKRSICLSSAGSGCSACASGCRRDAPGMRPRCNSDVIQVSAGPCPPSYAYTIALNFITRRWSSIAAASSACCHTRSTASQRACAWCREAARCSTGCRRNSRQHARRCEAVASTWHARHPLPSTW